MLSVIKRSVLQVRSAKTYNTGAERRATGARAVVVGRPIKQVFIGKDWDWEFPAYLFEGRINEKDVKNRTVKFPCVMASIHLETDPATGHLIVGLLDNYRTVAGEANDAKVAEMWKNLNPSDVDLAINIFLDGKPIVSVGRHGKPL